MKAASITRRISKAGVGENNGVMLMIVCRDHRAISAGMAMAKISASTIVAARSVNSIAKNIAHGSAPAAHLAAAASMYRRILAQLAANATAKTAATLKK